MSLKKIIENKKNILEEVENFSKNTMVDFLDIKILDLSLNGEEKFVVCGEMMVSTKVIQPMKILHGGASCVLAETLGSIGSYLVLQHSDDEEMKNSDAVGLEISANHLKSIVLGQKVSAKATLVHSGRRVLFWTIDLFNEKNELTCSSKLTVMTRKK